MRPRHRRELGRWTQTVFALSTRRVSGLMMINRSTMNYRSRRDPQHALRVRMRELAASRVRFGYRRLTVLLRREGWAVNAKRIYRLYTEDGLAVRTKVRKKIARRSRVPALRATRPNERWSMDFVAARLLDGRWFRVLTVVDQFTRECLLLLADSSLTGQKVALALSQVIAAHGAPVSIMVNMRDKLERWRQDYNQVRPHSALADHPPETFAARWAETAALRPEPNPDGLRKPATGNSLDPLT